MTADQPMRLEIEGAAEHNLRDLNVAFGDGLTAVVGVSGSGKSSLVDDVVYHEARRRLLASLSLASPLSRMLPARVRRIRGLTPAVALGQDSVIRNPNSTVATATGIHPFLRVIYARFATRTCPHCDQPVDVVSSEQRLARVRTLVAEHGSATLLAPLVIGAHGTHERLLSLLVERFGRSAIEVDGGAWKGRKLDPDAPHDIVLRGPSLTPRDGVAVRHALADIDDLGTTAVLVRGEGFEQRLASAPVCPFCGQHLHELAPTDFRDDRPEARGYRLGSLTLPALLALSVGEAAALVDALDLAPGAKRALREVALRLDALERVGLDYLTLDRPSPTLSRGEAQRLRLSVVLRNRIENVIHILDEPTIGLDPDQVGRTLDQLARLRGPVLMVEHDRTAVALADDVVEIGPGAGRAGGQIVFQGTPGALWQSETQSGMAFRATPGATERRRKGQVEEAITVRGASLRNLRGFDCRFPIGELTVVTGPSGAGKTTLVRDVLVASLEAGEPVGCTGVTGRALRALLVDQSPIGRNPRSNPATYSGLATRIRDLFARASGLPAGRFSFNTPDGACPVCEGIGAIELGHRYLAPVWLPCEACGGSRFREESLAVRVSLNGKELTIADVFELSVGEARELLRDDRAAARPLRALSELGLDYLILGQPSPSLSGGEAQRVKLARQLGRAAAGDLLVVDEPTTGLHPADLARLLDVLRRTTERGATVIVVEHHPDVVAAADWVVRLGPEGGPSGGRLLYEGAPERASRARARPRSKPRRRPRSRSAIRIRRAAAHNLRNASLGIRKKAITALVGVSGSGKSSLLVDVVAAEASRRLLECLSMYERQSVKEGPEAPVDSVEELGPTVLIAPQRQRWTRSTVGTQTDVSFNLAVLLAYAGARDCESCGARQRRRLTAAGAVWTCPRCGSTSEPVTPRHLTPAAYEAACLGCGGLGWTQQPREDKLIVQPEAPLCAGAMYSPGFFPQGYLCKPGNGGYDMVQALASRYGFDPASTPWKEMSPPARAAFLFGEDEPLEVLFRSKVRESVRTVRWPGFYALLGTDTGALYTEHVPCASCEGERLRPQYRRIHLGGSNRAALHAMALDELSRLLGRVRPPSFRAAAHALATARTRLDFLTRVGLGYVTLDRAAGTLSAGEAQRLRLAALLGGELTGMTVLLDEPSRGLHPSEVGALGGELVALRDQGNTIVLVEHDWELIRRVDDVVVMGPGAGRNGGRVVAQTTPKRLVHARPQGWARARRQRRKPSRELVIKRPRENNLVGTDVAVPAGVLVGLCGVSGSGKSTLAVDTLGRALAPTKLTSSWADEIVVPGAHDGIVGAPARTIIVDQRAQGVTSPGALLGVSAALRRLYASSDAAAAAGFDIDDLAPRCDACNGRGVVREDMGFLPDVRRACDVCDGTGYTAEVRELYVRERSLPELEALTLEEVLEIWGDSERIARPLALSVDLGLGYLALRQPAVSLSGGELQRLKLVHELGKKTTEASLYILDEPTVGQSESDVARLVDALDRLVEQGHTVLVIEHHAGLLAACDWLIELGPGAGAAGGRVVAAGTPEHVARRRTATAPYLREVLS